METRTRKWIGLALVAAVLFTIAPAVQADFPTDEPYRIAFITSTKASVSTMPLLNTWVTGLANADGSIVKDMATNWYAVAASTDGTWVFDYTDLAKDSTNSVPIYDAGGRLMADNYAQFWSNTAYTDPPSDPHVNPDKFLWITEQNGTPGGTGFQTGLDTTGSGPSDYTVVKATGLLYGDTNISVSGLDWQFTGGGTGGLWVAVGDDWGQGLGGMQSMAISEVIPEPATMSLLAIGGVALLRRKRNS